MNVATECFYCKKGLLFGAPYCPWCGCVANPTDLQKQVSEGMKSWAQKTNRLISDLPYHSKKPKEQQMSNTEYCNFCNERLIDEQVVMVDWRVTKNGNIMRLHDDLMLCTSCASLRRIATVSPDYVAKP